MRKAFRRYPRKWGLKRTDRNIDHRRVLNLATFWTRRGASLPLPSGLADWQPGDLVTQRLPGDLPHLGIVADTRDQTSGRLRVIHNIARDADRGYPRPVRDHRPLSLHTPRASLISRTCMHRRMHQAEHCSLQCPLRRDRIKRACRADPARTDRSTGGDTGPPPNRTHRTGCQCSPAEPREPGRHARPARKTRPGLSGGRKSKFSIAHRFLWTEIRSGL